MAEKIYMIPVNDAFDKDSECPVCVMYNALENDAIDFVMGPSYMEDDVRSETDRLGFCRGHMKMLLEQPNKLGLALMLHTHTKKVMADTEKLMKSPLKAKSLFKKTEESPLLQHMEALEQSCYICQRIDNIFKRYLTTTLQLYHSDVAFREKYASCKGFCGTHYGMLLKEGQKILSGKEFETFVQLTNRLYLENMKRVEGDLAWFIEKYDYRNAKEPWKNAKDAIPRTATKVNGIYKEDTIVASRVSH